MTPASPSPPTGDATRRRVIVIGAGAVGVASAWALRRQGHAVTLIERDEPGRACSFGNAGVISECSVVPMPGPELLRQVPRWLLNPLNPLAVRPAYLPRLTPWLLRFLAACRGNQQTIGARAMAPLCRDAVTAWRAMADEAGLGDLLQTRGWLHLYLSDTAFQRGRRRRALERELGVRLEELGGNAVRDLEPALATTVRHGVLYPDSGHVLSPYRLVSGLAERFVASGGVLLQGEAVDIRKTPDAAAALSVHLADGSRHAADTVVLAAGAWSGALARRVGAPVPLESERGYHLHLPRPAVALNRGIVHGEGGFAVTPMMDGLRIAGTAEFASLSAAPNWNRTAPLAAGAAALLPGLDLSDASRWMGHRPSTADFLPVIAPSARLPGLIFNFGHQHLGLTLAAVSAGLVAALVAGTPPTVDLKPFRPERFAAARAA
ncbi:MAG: FAD-dependent oxidoreductase [Alphaproteobacteria bacterium]